MATNKSSTTRLVPNFVLISSAFAQTPFLKLSKPLSLPTVSQNIIREIHDSIASTADKFNRLFLSFASTNPVLNKFISLSSELNAFCHQIRSKNLGNLKFSSLNHNFAAILPGDSVVGIVVGNGVLNFLNIYNTLLVVRLVLTWFPNTPPAIVSPLSTLCDPYLNIFRGIIPPLGGTLDLSPILAFLVLNALTSTASALPCELPAEGAVRPSGSVHPGLSELTSSQKKWRKRVSKNSTDDN